jgi:hypothetical protein
MPAASNQETLMLILRRAEDRGRADFGWLDSRHTFSFGQYHDPQHMGFGPLRVINDDRVAPGGGFATHGHSDMEIISYVLDGALEHRDSLGNGSVIRPGDVQRMSAGTGIRHSEFNASKTEPVHFLQIWILPERMGVAPGYEQKNFAPADTQGRLRLVASRQGREGSVSLHRDVDLFAARLGASDAVGFDLKPGRLGWLQVARGEVVLDGEALRPGDGVAFERAQPIAIAGMANAADAAEILLFDMAGPAAPAQG